MEKKQGKNKKVKKINAKLIITGILLLIAIVLVILLTANSVNSNVKSKYYTDDMIRVENNTDDLEIQSNVVQDSGSLVILISSKASKSRAVTVDVDFFNDKGDITGENNFMTNVINTYSNYQAKQTELSSEYEDLLEVIKAQIETVVDAETANEVVKSLAGMQHIFDSKLQAGQLLNKKCKGLGLKFDKIKKEYAAA